jgi:hypothetical protein
MIKKRLLSNDRFDIQTELIDELGNEMAKSIDAGILLSILASSGWHMVKLDRFKNNRQAVDIGNWCLDNAKGQWHHNGSTFIFEQQKDATWFALNWL